MCQYSREGNKTRRAKEGETVYVVSGSHGAFSSKPDQYIHALSEPAVCVLYDQKLTIENVQAVSGLRSDYSLARYVGKRQVVTLRQKWPNGAYGDHFEFEDGYTVPSCCLSALCPIYVGVKSDSKKGMQRITEALTEVSKTPPRDGVLTTIKRAVSRKRKVTT